MTRLGESRLLERTQAQPAKVLADVVRTLLPQRYQIWVRAELSTQHRTCLCHAIRSFGPPHARPTSAGLFSLRLGLHVGG